MQDKRSLSTFLGASSTFISKWSWSVFVFFIVLLAILSVYYLAKACLSPDGSDEMTSFGTLAAVHVAGATGLLGVWMQLSERRKKASDEAAEKIRITKDMAFMLYSELEENVKNLEYRIRKTLEHYKKKNVLFADIEKELQNLPIREKCFLANVYCEFDTDILCFNSLNAFWKEITAFSYDTASSIVCYNVSARKLSSKITLGASDGALVRIRTVREVYLLAIFAGNSLAIAYGFPIIEEDFKDISYYEMPNKAFLSTTDTALQSNK